jgi:hypothetical protein
MRLAWWKRKQRRVPAKALAGIPAPGLRTGVGHVPHFRARERISRGNRGLTGRSPIASAVFSLPPCGAEQGISAWDFTYPPLRPPDCGSKMTAGTIGDGFYRTHHHNSRGRVHRSTARLPRAGAFSLTPMKRRVLSWQGKGSRRREWGFSTSPPPSGGIPPSRPVGGTSFPAPWGGTLRPPRKGRTSPRRGGAESPGFIPAAP